MEFDRAGLKQSVKLSMKGTRPRPTLVALAFTVIVSAGTWLINTILGRLLTGGVSSISDTVQYYMLQGYEVDYAVEAAMLDLLRMGMGLCSEPSWAALCCPSSSLCGAVPWRWALRATPCPWSAMKTRP